MMVTLFDNVVPKELALRLSATDRHTSQLIGLSAGAPIRRAALPRGLL
jgi:hypothetical protein